MAEKIMLLDGNSIINRAFYGVPLLTNSEGRYTNAVYGFLNILLKLIDEEHPEYLAVAFDLPAPTFRHKKYEPYKATRKGMPNELGEQMPLLKEVLTAMNIKQYELSGYEADDILGTLSKKAEDKGYTAVVVSGDRDLLQIASDTLKVRIPKTRLGKTTIEDYYKKDVLQKYGVTPTEFIDLKALMGDASDNIPGVPGIGEKTATKIIIKYHCIEQAIENASQIMPKRASSNLIEFKKQAYLSKELATIVRDMPIDLELEKMKTDRFFNAKAYELFKKLEFKSLFDRFQHKKEQTSTKNYCRITTVEQCENLCQQLQAQKETAYVLIHENSVLLGIAFFSQQIEGVFLQESDNLSLKKALSILTPFFTEKLYPKIAHDAKTDIKILRKYGIEESAVCFDTAIAGYVLNPTRESYEYNDLAAEFLNQMYPSKEEILGKGRNLISFQQLSEEQKLEYAVCQAEVFYKTKSIMAEKLRENNQENLYYQIELPLIYVLLDMEYYGIKVDERALIDYQKALEIHIEQLTHEIYHLAGEEFNINSPKQLGVILFEKLGLNGSKKTKTGYSTAADILEKLKTEHPIVDKILLFRQLAKLKSTYADGLLNVMDKETKKIYSTFHQTITATGRISSTEPNLQNIPIRLELGRQLRKVFIPTDDNYLFLDADYSQIELRVLAHISEDETLIDAFKNNQDIHRLTASQVFNIAFDEVTARQRSNAKAVNFGIVYGIGSFSLSQDLGISRKEAEEYIEGYFAKYPKIKGYMDRTIENARKQGYVSTLFHRRRAMPELKSQNFNMRSFGERVAMNMPIQGSAADIIKIAMIKVHKSLKDAGLKSKLILQVHDELLLEVHKEEIEEVTMLLRQNMEHAVELAVPLDIDIHKGSTWYDAK